jgi:hypothetical protein
MVTIRRVKSNIFQSYLISVLEYPISMNYSALATTGDNSRRAFFLLDGIQAAC